MDFVFIIVPIIFGVVFVSIFTMSIINAVKHAKRINKLSSTIEDTIVDKFNQVKAEAEEQKNPYVTCDYCGSTNKKTDTSCSNCGANLNFKKKK